MYNVEDISFDFNDGKMIYIMLTILTGSGTSSCTQSDVFGVQSCSKVRRSLMGQGQFLSYITRKVNHVDLEIKKGSGVHKTPLMDYLSSLQTALY